MQPKNDQNRHVQYDDAGNVIIGMKQKESEVLEIQKNKKESLPAKDVQMESADSLIHKGSKKNISKNQNTHNNYFSPNKKPESNISTASDKNIVTTTKESTAKKAKNVLWNIVKDTASTCENELDIISSRALDEAKKIKNGSKKFHASIPQLFSSFLVRLQSPIHVPKLSFPQTATGQFFLDTIRFGGTFAAIFFVLFSAMNFQSFLQIAKAELALDTDTKTEQALQDLVLDTNNSPSPNKSQKNKNISINEGALLSYLPEVGPYENRIIIPKIEKNLPIVQPKVDALMKEDWKQFEADIQDALLSGVVHYPGSAKPGREGNAFFTAHSSYFAWSKSQHKDDFARLGSLEPGDVFSIFYGGDKYTYRVTAKKEVKPTDVSVLDQPLGKRMATLMTCTPVGTTLRRLIVTAEEIDPATGQVLAVGERTSDASVESLRHKISELPI